MTGGDFGLVKSGHFLVCIVIAFAALCALSPEDALAIRKQPRPDYVVGVGWGLGRGTFNAPDGSRQEYTEGGVSLIRVGRMITPEVMLTFNYSGWIIEYSDTTWDWVPESVSHFAAAESDSAVIKNRRSQQQVALGLYWFPGNPHGASGGIYLRASAGMGWSGTNELLIESDNPQGHGSRIDEWGWGISAEGGYEFWVAGNASLGVGAFYNYMSVRDTIVDNGWFTGASMNFNIYF
jgi:hypothetical protein